AFTDALAAPAAPRPPSVAVLPFRNLSADPENEYFADGITEDVIAHLSKVRALKVISRTSVMPFKQREQSLKEIAARLEAATLLDGSVRRAGDRVRIVAQLVDAETERHLWAETYDRQLTDIFGIQTDVALHTADAPKAELSVDERTRIRKEPTSDLRAYQLYLLGRHWLVRYTPAALQRAIEHFRGAIARDPAYALAYAAVAMAYAELAESGAMAPDTAAREAKDAAAHAVRIDPQLGEAHCTVAYLKSIWDFDWTGAEAEFQRALELSPNSADTYDLYGRMCSAVARYDEAVTLTPGNTQWLAQLGQAYALAGKVDRARDVLRQLDERARETYVSPYHVAYVYTGLGEPERAMDLLERAFEQRAGAIYGIKGSFLFEPLRVHPRFQALLARLNLGSR